MRWLEPGFLLNQRSHREELMDRSGRIRLLTGMERKRKDSRAEEEPTVEPHP
jgi:hypothetical protein